MYQIPYGSLKYKLQNKIKLATTVFLTEITVIL